jgi:hypothetical protein
MSIAHEIAYAISRNPKINRVIVSPAEYDAILNELHRMNIGNGPTTEQIYVREDGPRPIYNITILKRPIEMRR